MLVLCPTWNSSTSNEKRHFFYISHTFFSSRFVSFFSFFLKIKSKFCEYLLLPPHPDSAGLNAMLSFVVWDHYMSILKKRSHEMRIKNLKKWEKKHTYSVECNLESSDNIRRVLGCLATLWALSLDAMPRIPLASCEDMIVCIRRRGGYENCSLFVTNKDMHVAVSCSRMNERWPAERVSRFQWRRRIAV